MSCLFEHFRKSPVPSPFAHAVRLLPSFSPPPLYLSLSLRFFLSSLYRVIFVVCATCLILSKDTSVYLSTSVCTVPLLSLPPTRLGRNPTDFSTPCVSPSYVPSWTINFNFARISFKSRIRHVVRSDVTVQGWCDLVHLDNIESIIKRDGIRKISKFIYNLIVIAVIIGVLGIALTILFGSMYNWKKHTIYK